MIKNIQDLAAYFGASTPTELVKALWNHDSYVSAARFVTKSGDSFTTYPDFFSLSGFPVGVVSVIFYGTREGCEYEPKMTPLVFPFPKEDIDEAIDWLDSELDVWSEI